MRDSGVKEGWEARIFEEIARDQAKIRMFGGRAIRHHVVGRVRPEFVRPPGDLDLFTVAAHRKAVSTLLEHTGLRPDREFNLLNGKTRLIYYAGDEKVDVFIDEFTMCHRLDLRGRMHLETITLPLADLILTKLQIYELTAKDMADLYAIVLAAPLSEEDRSRAINIRHIAGRLAADWGLWRTCTGSLKRLRTEAQTVFDCDLRESREAVHAKLDAITEAIERAPKSMAWKMRAVVGEKVKWYELPEEP